MLVMFRADGNEQTGAGHIMRCISIAQKAIEQGSDCVFVTADDFYYHKITDYGIPCTVLNSDYRDLESELPNLLADIEAVKPDRMIVDSYYVTKRYLKKIKEKTVLVYIDDTASSAYPADILVNYNVYGTQINYAELYQKAGVMVPRLLLGPRFVPLRKEFCNVKAKTVKDIVSDIFVSAGGSDPEHIMKKMIEYLKTRNELTKGKRYHFVIGDFESDREEICSLALKYDWIKPHWQVRRMSELMLSCDAAVSAAGSTLYELCACGVPAVTYILADNQVYGAQEFARQKVMLNAGDMRTLQEPFEKIFGLLFALCKDSTMRRRMSERARNLADGKGTFRLLCNI